MQAFLEILRGEYGPVLKGETLIPLSPGEFLVGRDTICDFRPWCRTVSRLHCRISVTEAGVSVCDLDSRNGTKHNGQRISTTEALEPGDTLEIGPLLFRLVLAPAKQTACATPRPWQRKELGAAGG
jgi:pSer/pThr/pTyr-binding forkhead associated (FHA) protein